METIGGFRGPEKNASLEDTASQAGPRMAARFLVIVSLALLMFSALGPVLDHHFAERIPHHAHAFVGSFHLEHEHPFEAVHIHDDMLAHAVVQDTQRRSFSGTDGVLYLTPDESLGQSYSPMALTIDPASWAFPEPSSGIHEFAFIGGNQVPDSWKTPPLEKPPQL